MAQSGKPITSPVPEAWYPTLAFSMLSIGLLFAAIVSISTKSITKQRLSTFFPHSSSTHNDCKCGGTFLLKSKA
ncbi:hypothetical protein MKW94_023993 [Papaver nudicaule]|uniref:Dolichyl-diphosphooligosaccharide-protein glycosyltransferase subunit OST5 n=1 Tax=Papaver nudicaule TaxID=74823 RepID=A0AA41V961_PAPNU|nr:hypothetical protein [Papaver nudicaule]